MEFLVVAGSARPLEFGHLECGQLRGAPWPYGPQIVMETHPIEYSRNGAGSVSDPSSESERSKGPRFQGAACDAACSPRGCPTKAYRISKNLQTIGGLLSGFWSEAAGEAGLAPTEGEL